MMRIVLLLALAAGCAFDTSGLPASEDAVDAAIAHDAPPPETAPDAADPVVVPDAADPVVVPDAAAPIDPGGGEIGADCEEDDDCSTGACESAGRGIKRCAIACSPDVPCPDELVCRRGICES